MTADDVILTEPELQRITGYSQPARVLQELHRQGFYRARLARTGIVLERLHYEAVRAGARIAAPTDYSRLIPAQAVDIDSARRHAALAARTPAWADLDAIEAVYAEARRITAATGMLHHVDHEIPLRGRLVSGLHVHSNLRVLPGDENVRKGNRFEP